MSYPPALSSRTRRLLAATFALVAVVGMLAAPPAAAADTPLLYEDATKTVHTQSIAALERVGILDGTGCGLSQFCPDQPLPRWVMGVWLARSLDSVDPAPTTSETAPSPGLAFADVNGSVWWAPDIETLALKGVTSGCSTAPPLHFFCPEEPVTRGQMASFITRAFDLAPSVPMGFTDIAGNTHEASINSLAAANITAGCGSDSARYCPDDLVTRAQMATFLARAMNLADIPENTALQPAEVYPDVGLVGEQHIIYGRGDQHIWLVNADGTLFDSYPVSGRATWPPPGRYKVFSKSPFARALRGGLTMEHMVRFLQPPGKASTGFHSIPRTRNGTPIQTEDELGQFRSSGCVRQRDDKAEQLYEWAPLGTRVVVLP